jgi:hypothetical protein
MYQRSAIMPRIVPDAERSVEARTAELESLIAEKIQKLAADGILRAMPAGESEDGRFQLRQKLLRDDFDVLAAKGRLTIAQDELAAAKVNALLAPSGKCLDRTVPAVGIELADLILRQELVPIEGPYLSEPAQALREVLGLNNAPLLAEHVHTLHAIQHAIGVPDGGNGTNVGNFRKLTATVGERVAALIEQLPPTEARNRAMQECRECNRDERRFGDSRPRTTYLERETVEAAS